MTCSNSVPKPFLIASTTRPIEPVTSSAAMNGVGLGLSSDFRLSLMPNTVGSNAGRIDVRP